MKKKLLFLVMFLCVLGLVAQAETVVTTEDGNGADTFVGNDTNKPPTYNYGGDNDMDIRHYTDVRAHLGFARWDITDIGGMDPTGVQLRLWITSSGSSRTWDIYALNDSTLDDNWDEMSITYDNCPWTLAASSGSFALDPAKTSYLGNILAPSGSEYAHTEAIVNTTDPNGVTLEDVIKADTNNLVTLIFVAPADGSGRQYYVNTKEGTAGDSDPNVISPTLVLPADVNPSWATDPVPAMHEVVNASLSQLSWTAPEPNQLGGIITYDIYHGTTEPNALQSDYGLTTLATGTDSNSVSLPSAPDPLTQYYWVVDVHDSSNPGVTTRGLAWSYNTNNLAPTVDAGADQYVWIDKIALGSDADTWMRDGYLENGDDPLMNVAGIWGFYSYLRFDLSAYNAANITDATLTLTKVGGGWRNDGMTTGRFQLYGMNNVTGNTAQDWGEMDLTWNNAGAEFDSGDNTLATSIADGRVVNLDMEDGMNITESTDGTTMTITGADLVSFLQARAADGGLATFILNCSATNRAFAVGTKEATDPAAVPVLNLTTVTNPGTVDVTLDGTVTDDGQPYGTLDYLWEQVSGPETVTITPDNTEDTAVTIGTSGYYEFQLSSDDGAEVISDTVQIYVGTSACDAAQEVPGYEGHIADLNADCFVDLKDFATLAAGWLDCTSLVCP